MINKNWVGLYTLARREVTRFMRIWTQTLLPPIISITLYFIIFGTVMGGRIGPVGGVNYIDYIIPGLIMMSIITNSYANVVSSFFGSKFQRNLEEMLVSPLSNTVILWGFLLGGVLRGCLVGILVTLIALLFTHLHIQHVALTFLIGVLTTILFALAGFINGIFAKTFDDINIVPTFILTPLTYLGGVFYSLEALPGFWKTIIQINPMFHMINAFRFGVLGESDVDVRVALGMIIGLIIVLYTASLWMLRKGIGIKH